MRDIECSHHIKYCGKTRKKKGYSDYQKYVKACYIYDLSRVERLWLCEKCAKRLKNQINKNGDEFL